jgi:hypothetical protein
MSENKKLVPTCILYVNGERIDHLWEGPLRSIRVVDSLNEIGACAITFARNDKDAEKIFPLSSTLSVLLGYKDDMREVFNGIITGSTPVFAESGGEECTIAARSHLYQLDINWQMRSFANLSPSGIIEKIFDEYGLQVECEPFGAQCEYTAEEGMTDWQYVLLFAEQYGKDIASVGEKAYVKDRMTHHEDEYIYEWGKSLISFKASVDIREQLGGIQVTGYDPLRDEGFMGEATIDDLNQNIGGTKDWTYLYSGGDKPQTSVQVQ